MEEDRILASAFLSSKFGVILAWPKGEQNKILSAYKQLCLNLERMIKLKRKVLATLVAISVFIFATLGATPVNAKETNATEATVIYSNEIPENAEILDEFDVTLDQLRSITLLDTNWNFTGNYTDINRQYAYRSIGFSVQISDPNNSGDAIHIELVDNTSGSTQIFMAYSDSGLYGFNNVAIIKNRAYHFTFTDITNSSTYLSMHFVVYH